MVFTHNEKLLISDGGSEIKIWENASGRLLKNIPYPPDKAGKDVSNTELLAVSPDDKTLVFQYVDTLYFYNLEKFGVEKKYKLANPWTTLVFTPDGKTIYGGGQEMENYDHFFIQKNCRWRTNVRAQLQHQNAGYPYHYPAQPESR